MYLEITNDIHLGLKFGCCNAENRISGEGELTIDTICRSLDLPVFKLSSLLLQMEFKGVIKCYPGNIYRIS